MNDMAFHNYIMNSFLFSLVPAREKSTALAAKPASALSNKGEYVITKLDDLVNWARRVRMHDSDYDCSRIHCLSLGLQNSGNIQSWKLSMGVNWTFWSYLY